MADIDSFLKTIGQIESSSGKNTNHPIIETGIQKGDRAIGTYALMPNTVDEIITRAKNENKSSEEMDNILNMSPEEKKAYIEANPEIEKALATNLAGYVLNKQGGDTEKAAYSWLHGHNLSPDRIENKDYSNDPYVQKFAKLSGSLRSPAMSQKSKENLPFDMGGTPEGDKLVGYLGGSSPKDVVDMNSFQRASLKDTLSRSPDEISLSSMNTPEKQPEINNGFDKLLSSLAPSNKPAPMLPVPLPVAPVNQKLNIKTPTIQEVLNNIKNRSVVK